MAAKRTQRHPHPSPAAPDAQSLYRVLEPTGGINRSQPPQHLTTDEAWDLHDFTFHDGHLRLRSGLSAHGDASGAYDDAWLLAARIQAKDSSEHLLLASRNTLQRSVDGGAWSAVGSVGSNASNAHYSYAEAYNVDGLHLVAVNGANAFYYTPATGAIAPLSLSTVAPITQPRFVTAIDERLLFISGDGEERTAQWSTRGDMLCMEDGDAGFQILPELRGTPTGLARDGDVAYIFTTAGVWQATPRRDIFAFEFMRLDAPGCAFPRTIAETPRGVIYLSDDLRLYSIHQGEARAVDIKAQTLLKETLTGAAADVFGVYDITAAQYVLFHSGQALVLTLSGEGGITTWQMPNAQAALSLPADASEPIRLGIASSDGQFYRTHSGASGVEGIYTTPALVDDFDGALMPTAAWVDYSATTHSRLTLRHSTDLFSADSRDVSAVTLPAGTGAVYIPFIAPTTRYPQLQLRLSAPSDDVSIARIRLQLRRYSGRFV